MAASPRDHQHGNSSSPAHQGAPGKGEAEPDLRPIGEPFHERINRYDRQRRDPKLDSEKIEPQQDRKPGQRLQHEEKRGPCNAHLS